MLKNFIAPVQSWLLGRGQCVACGMPLAKGTVGKSKKGETTVTCKCGRIFIQEAKSKTYRRALLSEV